LNPLSKTEKRVSTTKFQEKGGVKSKKKKPPEQMKGGRGRGRSEE